MAFWKNSVSWSSTGPATGEAELVQRGISPLVLGVPAEPHGFGVAGLDCPPRVRVDPEVLVVEPVALEEVDLVRRPAPQRAVEPVGEVVGEAGPVAGDRLGVARLDAPARVRIHPDVLGTLEEVDLVRRAAPQRRVDARGERGRHAGPVARDRLGVARLDGPARVRVHPDVLGTLEEVDLVRRAAPQRRVDPGRERGRHAGPVARDRLGVARVGVPPVVRVDPDVLAAPEEVDLLVRAAPEGVVDVAVERLRQTRPVGPFPRGERRQGHAQRGVRPGEVRPRLVRGDLTEAPLDLRQDVRPLHVVDLETGCIDVDDAHGHAVDHALVGHGSVLRRRAGAGDEELLLGCLAGLLPRLHLAVGR